MEKLYYTDIGQNESAVTILISDNVDFRAKQRSQGKRKTLKIIMGLSNQEAT